MKRFRIAVLALVAVTMGALSAAAVGAQPPPGLSVVGSPVAPGGTFTVAGSGCPSPGEVLIGLLDADEESALAMASATESGGSWSAEVQVDSDVRPGVYTLRARCATYTGGYDGYDGGGFDYALASVTVLPPATTPEGESGLTVTPNVLKPGDTAQVTGSGWRTGEQVTVVLYSSPVVIASTTTNDQGAIDVSVTIPPDTTLGAHDVVAMNASSAVNPALTLRAPITVVGDDPTEEEGTGEGEPVAVTSEVLPTTATAGGGGSLPVTGSDPRTWIAAGLALLLAGAIALRLARKPLVS